MRWADCALLSAGAILPVVVAFSNALAEIAATSLCVALFIRVILQRPHWSGGWTFALLVGVWLAACLISTAFALEPDRAFRAFSNKTFEYALVALAMSLLGRHEDRLRVILRTLAWAGLVFSFDGLIQWKFGHDLFRWHTPWASRITGPMGNPNNFATYLVIVIPIQLWAMVDRPGRSRILLGLGVVLGVVSLVLTDSGAAWLIFSLNLLLCAVLMRRTAVLAYFPLLVIGLWWLGELPSLASTFSLSPGRLEGWMVAWQMFLDHPVAGIGLGGFMEQYMRYLPAGVGGTWPRPQYAHNCYLQLLAEGGVIGLGAFLLMVGWVLVLAVRRLKDAQSASRSPLSGLLVSLIAFLVGIIFDTGLYSLPIALLFWSLLGLAAGWIGNEENITRPS